MKNLIKLLTIIGLVSMSQLAVAQAIENVEDGDVLTADGVNQVIDATNDNSAAIADAQLDDFDINEPPACLPSEMYKVGDDGPSGDPGSLVFYVTADGCNGLEAAGIDAASASGSKHWGCFGENVSGAFRVSIGGGGPNTLDVVNQACSDPAEAVAAAREYMGGGEDDWYLGSRDEVVEMYNTIGPGGANTGGFVVDGVYWTSSEIDADAVYVVNFKNGSAPDNPKNFARETRPIRTILDPPPE